MDRIQAMNVFCRVVDCQGFAAAARELDLSPSVVTRLINELEAHLGVRLLNRTTRTLVLTAAGERYLEKARQLLLDLQDMEDEAGSATTDPSGRLKVQVPPAFAAHQLARVLPTFLARFPRISIELVAPNVVESIDDSFDLCIVVSASGQLDGQFVARRLTCSHIIACASPAFLDRRGRPSHPGDYTALSLVHPAYVHELTFRPEREAMRALRAAQPGAVTVVPAPAVMLSSHIDTLYAAALAGLGASGFPSYVVDDALKQGRLERVLPGWSLSVLHLFATYPSRRYMPMRTRVFLDFLIETFGGQERDPWLGI